MAKYLVVVESPAKAKTINKFLGSSYSVKASYGHVRDLPKSDLGVDIENDFEPKYVRPRASMKTIKEISKAAEKAQHILLATDPDREGEAIGWHIAELLRKKDPDKPIERIVFNEITKKSIREAAQKPRKIDDDLVNAQQARRVVDRLVGYKISPLLQRAIRRGLSAGRVQSVAVRMVCEREQEIRVFEPVEYWTLDSLLATEKEEELTARLFRIKGEKAELGSEDAVNAVLHDLEGKPWAVDSVERKEVRRRPSAPFITSSLQQEASRRLRFSPRKTMMVAQQLYEGIALGSEGSVGLITYMRTDSTRIAGEALSEVRSYIGEHFDSRMLPEKPNFYASKKGAQDAHEAIRPTSANWTPDAIKQYLDKDQLRLYELIWKRFVASQMAPAVLDQTTIDVAVGDYTFRATGSIMKFPGFTTLYEEGKDEKNGENGGNILPDVREDQPLDMRELKPEQHFTKPPPRYSEATLIRALEANGIGRPSTYAPTINTIVDRGYVVREKRRLHPTELGDEVNAWLVTNFPTILDIDFTASLEAELDHVEEGRQEWRELLREFYGPFHDNLLAAQNRVVEEIFGDDVRCPKCDAPMEVREAWYGLFLGCTRHPECDGTRSLRKQAKVEETDEVCEKCGASMVIRTGRFGKFMACSAYPECKNSHNIDEHGNKVENPAKEEPVKTDQKCPECGAHLLIRKNRRGEEFYGCEAYPKCRFTKPRELGLKCPKPDCNGELVLRVARRRRFVGCDQYPKCDFTAYGQLDREHGCEKCGNSWTTITKPRNKPRVRRCPLPDCDWQEELPEEVEEKGKD